MENGSDYLDEFETVKLKSTRLEYFIARLDFIFLIVIIGILLYKHIYIKLPLNQDLVYQCLFMLLMPLLFWVLFAKNYKIGWFLRLLYYSFFVIVLTTNILSEQLQNQSLVSSYIVAIISAIIVVTSFLRITLDKLKIGWKLISAYVILALLFVWFCYEFVFLKK